MIGRNGSGKSTLLAIMAGLLKPDSGTVQMNGSPLSAARIGYVPQQDSLFEELTVKDNILFRAAGANLSARKAAEADCVRLLDLHSIWKKKVRNLSGGMRRRVAIAASLIHSPDLILLDEPFSGLDLVQKQELLAHLCQLKQQGKTILYATHNTDEIVPPADAMIALQHGQTTVLDIRNMDPAEIRSTVMQILRQE